MAGAGAHRTRRGDSYPAGAESSESEVRPNQWPNGGSRRRLSERLFLGRIGLVRSRSKWTSFTVPVDRRRRGDMFCGQLASV